MSNVYTLPEGNVQIAFSGGRSSAYMLHEILRVNGPLPERVVVSFQNTGREHEATLDFVRECGARWGVNIVWLEYRQGTPRFTVVDHASASRNGEPFEALIRHRRFLPNQAARFCTAELKIRTVQRYLVAQGWPDFTVAVGLRADEQRRLKRAAPRERWTLWYPMAEAGVVKQDITRFWAAQPFDLRLTNINGKTPDGNCDGCFLKSEAYLAWLSVRDPAAHRWWEDMEALASTFTDGSAATFSKRYARRDLRDFMERQGGVAGLDQEGALCQADDGECFG